MIDFLLFTNSQLDRYFYSFDDWFLRKQCLLAARLQRYLITTATIQDEKSCCLATMWRPYQSFLKYYISLLAQEIIRRGYTANLWQILSAPQEEVCVPPWVYWDALQTNHQRYLHLACSNRQLIKLIRTQIQNLGYNFKRWLKDTCNVVKIVTNNDFDSIIHHFCLMGYILPLEITSPRRLFTLKKIWPNNYYEEESENERTSRDYTQPSRNRARTVPECLRASISILDGN